MTSPKRDWELAIVTELDVEPYGLHNVPVLALYPELSYRFRYMADDFQVDVPSKRQLQGKWGLLVLRDRTTPQFIPIREFRVERVDEQGDIIFLELAFDRYVVYDRAKPLSQYYQDIASALDAQGIASSRGASLPAYVVTVPHKNLAPVPVQTNTRPQDYARTWQDLVRKLARTNLYSDVRFFRLAGIRPVGAERNINPRQVGHLGAGYRLAGGTTYCVDVMHFAPGDHTPGAHPIALDGSPQFFKFPKREERVDGAYDMITLMLYVEPQAFSKQNAILTLESTQPFGDDLIPPVFLPLEITWSLGTWLAKIIPAVCSILGLLVIIRVDWLASSTGISEHVWTILGPVLLGYGIGSFSLLANVLAPRLQSPDLEA